MIRYRGPIVAGRMHGAHLGDHEGNRILAAFFRLSRGNNVLPGCLVEFQLGLVWTLPFGAVTCSRPEFDGPGSSLTRDR